MIRTITSALIFTLILSFAHAQTSEEVRAILKAGVKLHDEGKYQEAIEKYSKAIQADPTYFAGYYERGYSYDALQKYENAIADFKKALELIPADQDPAEVYCGYGNTLDKAGKSQEALRIFDEGIQKSPEDNMLFFNKGIALTALDRMEEAEQNLIKSASLNPRHPGTQSMLARVVIGRNERVICLMAMCRFFILEPLSERAKMNLEVIEVLLSDGVEKTGKKNINITIDSDRLPDSTGRVQENDFRSAEMLFVMTGAIQYTKEVAKKTLAEQFGDRFSSLAEMLEEQRRENYGFYWTYYADYFIELHKKGYDDVLSNLIYASTGEKAVLNWMEKNKERIKEFYSWSSAYKWPEEN